MKRILVTLLCLGIAAASAVALDAGDYRIFWSRPDGTVLGGFTNGGRFESLAGVTAGGLITATEGLTVETGKALTLSGTATLTMGAGTATLGGALGVTGLTTLDGALYAYGGTHRIGFDSDAYMQIAVTETTGVTAITHVGTGATVAWTADSFGFTGDTSITGTLDATGAVSFDSALDVVGTLTVGEDASAGTITLYPGTTTTGTTTLTMSDNAGDTVTNINVAEQAGARTYTIPDSGESTSEILLTDNFKTWWTFAIGLSGEDTDGAGTNGGGIASGPVDLTTHQYNDGAGSVYVKCYDAGDAAWDDLSTSGTLTGWTANYQLQPDAASEAVGDAVAIGHATNFCEIAFDDLATGSGALATYTNDAGKWQYSTGAGTWSDLTVFDNTDLTLQDGKRPFQRTGAISFAPPSDWVAVTIDGQEGYWIQWVFTATELTQPAIIDTTNKDEPFVVIPTSDTFDAAFKCSINRIRVTNLSSTVHDQAIKFIIANFTTGVFSTELTWTASQRHDKFDLGTALEADIGDLVGICVTDDGGSTENPEWAIEMQVVYTD